MTRESAHQPLPQRSKLWYKPQNTEKTNPVQKPNFSEVNSTLEKYLELQKVSQYFNSITSFTTSIKFLIVQVYTI